VSSQHQGTGSFDIPKSVDLKKLGVEGSPSLDAKFAEVNYKRKTDYNFLTNEEYMKGIWLYRESMMPATSQMRQALDEYGSTKVNFTTGVARYLFYKRRFQDRSLQITSHLKMSVVPGFSVLILDDSDSDQNVIAYCTSVTHRIYATEGGYTNVQLSYARYTSEQDVASQGGTQFLTPSWFDELIFGPAPKADTTIAGKEVKALNPQGYPAQLSDFYATLLGNRGSSAITSLYAKENTIVGATRQLIASYREQKKKGSSNVMDYIAKTTAREYIKMIDYYKFFGAKTLSKNVELDKWITFSGVTFSRAGKTDQTAASIKTSVIQDYINNLKTQRGFRG
jgi:hypothetical protein